LPKTHPSAVGWQHHTGRVHKSQSHSVDGAAHADVTGGVGGEGHWRAHWRAYWRAEPTRRVATSAVFSNLPSNPSATPRGTSKRAEKDLIRLATSSLLDVACFLELATCVCTVRYSSTSPVRLGYGPCMLQVATRVREQTWRRQGRPERCQVAHPAWPI
jgi:hypothetical protein